VLIRGGRENTYHWFGSLLIFILMLAVGSVHRLKGAEIKHNLQQHG